MTYKGFELTGVKHPIGKQPGFPNGIWYGAVDGYQCTAPYWDEAGAIRAAKYQLEGGGFEATLKTSINCMQGWVSNGYEVEKATVRLTEESALLEKVAALKANQEKKS